MRKALLTLAIALTTAISLWSMKPNPIIIPDIEGYKTLKGDFHIHTVFSDATVWPTTRVAEALWEGLDIIAITDHVDTRLLKLRNDGSFNVEKCDRNRSYEIAKKAAAGKNLIVINGGEISRGMPPGHWNCLFVTDNDKIAAEAEKNDDNEMKAMVGGLKEARAQNAFTMWNHPNWEKQAPNETIMWPEHQKLMKEGYMHGIEIYNQFAGYCPEAHQWALDNNITMLGDSDAHQPFFSLIDYANGQHRPVTLVFATEKTAKGVREALDNQRTAVFAEETVYGREDILRKLFDACVTVSDAKFSDKQVTFRLTNNSCIPIRLKKAPGSESVYYVRNYELRPLESINVTVRPLLKNNKSQKFDTDAVDVNFTAESFQIGSDTPLPVKWTFNR